MQAVRVLILCTFAAAAAFAQDAAPPRWQRVQSSDGKFSIEMPGKPEHNSETLKAKNGHPVVYAAYTVDYAKSAYLVSTCDYDGETRFSLDAAIEGVLSTWEKPRIVSRKKTTLYGHPAQIVDFASGEYRVVTRALIVGRRLYQIGFVEAVDEYVPAHSDRFMSSFRLR